jgi:hypothetical protein
MFMMKTYSLKIAWLRLGGTGTGLIARRCEKLKLPSTGTYFQASTVLHCRSSLNDVHPPKNNAFPNNKRTECSVLDSVILLSRLPPSPTPLSLSFSLWYSSQFDVLSWISSTARDTATINRDCYKKLAGINRLFHYKYLFLHGIVSSDVKCIFLPQHDFAVMFLIINRYFCWFWWFAGTGTRNYHAVVIIWLINL